jgi:hypothetical protein
MFQHSNDKSGIASTLGQQAEDKFARMLKVKGINFRKATEYEDKYYHSDFYIIHKSKELGLDVKAWKKRYRYDDKPDSKYCFLELKNRFGYDSWLKDEGYIAFEYKSVFYICLKSDLRKLIRDKVDLKGEVIYNDERRNMREEELGYKLFRRRDQEKERVTMVEWEDIKSITRRVLCL